MLRGSLTPPVGHSSEIFGLSGADSSLDSAEAHDKKKNLDLEQRNIPIRPELSSHGKPETFVSYAWGDNASEQAQRRTEVVNRLCESLKKDGWTILRDNNVMRSGDLISGFMKRIGLADHVIVILSEKYLGSIYCMTELHSIYQRSVGEKEAFLRRIIPVVLDDAQIAAWRDRVAHAQHWRAEFEEMQQHFKDLGEV
jgi:hypothetical protein